MIQSDPNPPTAADLAEYGPAECLAALREQFAAAHSRLPQYRGWETDTELGVAEHQIGGGGTFVRAERGDLLLVKRGDRRGFLAGLMPDDVAWTPRVGWNVAIGYCNVRHVAA